MTEESVVFDVSPESTALVKTAMAEVVRGKITLGDLFERVTRKEQPEVPDKKPPVPMRLSEDVLQAIKVLPEVFGKTVVTADRKLTKTELRALVEERQVIDQVLAVLEKRKKESLREVLANHADAVLAESTEDTDSIRKDAKGHFAPWDTQNIPVEGTDLKVQRFASGGKPSLTIEHVERLHADGLIDRRTYLAITRKPDYPRVLDETGLHLTIQKQPSLFFLLATKAEPTLPTTTVKVVADK